MENNLYIEALTYAKDNLWDGKSRLNPCQDNNYICKTLEEYIVKTEHNHFVQNAVNILSWYIGKTLGGDATLSGHLRSLGITDCVDYESVQNYRFKFIDRMIEQFSCTHFVNMQEYIYYNSLRISEKFIWNFKKIFAKLKRWQKS